MFVPQGLLKPDLEATLSDLDSTLDLTTAVGFRIIAEQGGTVLFTDTSPTVDTATRKVTHAWVAGQTDKAGRGFYRVEVNFGDGKWVRFPQLGDLVFDIG